MCKSSEGHRNGAVIKNLRRSESIQVHLAIFSSASYIARERIEKLSMIYKMIKVLKSPVHSIYVSEPMWIMAGSRGADGVPKADGTCHD